jgi:hypothetical protein
VSAPLPRSLVTFEGYEAGELVGCVGAMRYAGLSSRINYRVADRTHLPLREAIRSFLAVRHGDEHRIVTPDRYILKEETLGKFRGDGQSHLHVLRHRHSSASLDKGNVRR